MNKYRVWAHHEIIEGKHQTWILLGTLEAESFENANEIAKDMFRNRGPFRIDDSLQDNGVTAYQFAE